MMTIMMNDAVVSKKRAVRGIRTRAMGEAVRPAKKRATKVVPANAQKMMLFTEREPNRAHAKQRC